MTVEALWQEYCDECGVRKKCPHAITGIIYEGDLVGFFTPTKRHRRPGLGVIYVIRTMRNKGIATLTALNFLSVHPDMTWYAPADNHISRHIAEKIGLTYLESHFSKGVEYLVYG